MRNLGACFIALCLLIAAFPAHAQQQLTVNNPSLEGTPAAHTVPSPWAICMPGRTPDTQPGQWGITQPASHGNTYISCLYSGSGSSPWVEGASQVLSSPMQAGTQYSMSVDLAFSPVYNTASPGNCYGSFILLAGNSNCGSTETLWQSGQITHSNWQT